VRFVAASDQRVEGGDVDARTCGPGKRKQQLAGGAVEFVVAVVGAVRVVALDVVVVALVVHRRRGLGMRQVQRAQAAAAGRKKRRGGV
jgi:hypothetical protein